MNYNKQGSSHCNMYFILSNFYFILYGYDLRAREKCGWLIK